MTLEKINMVFNSQICTNLEQSKELVKLGLKSETADMSYSALVNDFKGNEISEQERHYVLSLGYSNSYMYVGLEKREIIPAWSLSRLIEMLPPYISSMDACLVINRDGVSYESDAVRGESMYFQEDYGLFQNIVDCIEWLIKEGKLKTYLNEEA